MCVCVCVCVCVQAWPRWRECASLRGAAALTKTSASVLLSPSRTRSDTSEFLRSWNKNIRLILKVPSPTCFRTKILCFELEVSGYTSADDNFPTRKLRIKGREELKMHVQGIRLKFVRVFRPGAWLKDSPAPPKTHPTPWLTSPICMKFGTRVSHPDPTGSHAFWI